MERNGQWRAVAPHAIEWREWDDEVVVYNEGTGNTHHLSAFGSLVLRALLEHPSGLSVAALTRSIETRVESESVPSLESDVTTALAQLAELRLAERLDA